MARTGMQRSLTVVITKTLAGVLQPSYPRAYYGRNEFTVNGQTFNAIDSLRLETMPTEDYLYRLNAFKTYVETMEQGLSLATDTVIGSEAYRENLTACPIN